MEKFAIPCVAAIIEKCDNGKRYILMQRRYKKYDKNTNGLLEIPAGKIREYENIFVALKREIKEETGLDITYISGEKNAIIENVNGNSLISFKPYLVSQNLSGAYSIIVNTFLCKATGGLLSKSNESLDIHWVSTEELRDIVYNKQEELFIMHVNVLKKYLNEYSD